MAKASDVFQSVQRASVGALTPGLSIQEAIQGRKDPSDVIPFLKDRPWLGLAADIILDPLNLFLIGGVTKIGKLAKLQKFGKLSDVTDIGVKGLRGANQISRANRLDKAIKAGASLDELNKIAQSEGVFDFLKVATTLGGQAKKGQRAAVTLDVPFAPSLQGIPLIKGEATLGGLTKVSEGIRRILGPAGTKALGIRGATGASALDEIESIATALKGQREAQRLAKAADLKVVNQLLKASDIKKLQTGLKKATPDELSLFVARASVKTDDVSGLPKALQESLTTLQEKTIPEITSILKAVTSEADLLAGKGLSLTAVDEIIDAATGTQITGAARVSGGTPSILEKATQVKFTADDGSALIGRAEDFRLTQAPIQQKVVKANVKDLERRILPLIAKRKNLETQLAELGTSRAQAGTAKVRDELTGQLRAVGEQKSQIINELRPLQADLRAANSELEFLADTGSQQFINPAGEIFTRGAASPQEVNISRAERGLPAIFKEDAPLQQLQKSIRGAGRAAAKKTYTDEIARLVDSGDLGIRLEKGQKVPTGFAKSSLDELKDFAFPEQIVGHMDETFNKFSNIEGVNKFVNQYDKIQNTWKATATFVNLPFHVRNFVSNYWQIFLAGGLKDANAHTQAYGILAKVAKNKNLTKAEAKLWDEFRDFGLGGVGQFGIDIDRQFNLLKDNPIVKVGGAVGQYIEDSAKLGLFIQRKNAGFKTVDAAIDVRKFLFDYSDLTDFERNVWKRLFPFYTWTRKNMPLQVAMLIHEPRKFSLIPKVKKAIENSMDDEPMDPSLLPEWLREAYPIYFGSDGNGTQRFFKLEGWLPSVDINKLARPQEIPVELASPLFKTPIELIVNFDTFREQQIKEFPGQKREFFGVPIPVAWEKILRTLRPLGEAEKLIAPKRKLGLLPSPGERATSAFVGSGLVKLDEGRQRQNEKFRISQLVREAKSDVKKARKEGDTEEVQRLNDIIRQIKSGDLR